MRRLISGATYFFAISAVILIILGFAVNFGSKIFEIFPQEPTEPRPKTTRATDEIDEITEASSDDSIPADNPVYEIPVIDNVNIDNAITYDGDLELPVKGATGYATVDLDVLDRYDSIILATLSPGTAFVILQEEGNYWQIHVPSANTVGWVRHNLCMINLPDVIPSIIYDNTNAYRSVFMASEMSIPNVTNEQLYSYSDRNDGKAYNERLEKYEYIVPVLYSMSKKIRKAQSAALENGDTLVIIEGFRPASTQNKVYQEVTKLANSEPAVRSGFGNWNMSMFIAAGISNHQIGYAIDTTLAKITETEYKAAGEYKFNQSKGAQYTMPSYIHELSVKAALYAYSGSTTFSDGMLNSVPAQYLQKYCIEAGLTPLSSEWWHFNDEDTNSNLIKRGDGKYEITECLSESP